MEKMVDFNKLFNGIYKGKNVLITGHTGFKGSWLALWLEKMGANVFGYSLPNNELNHLNLLNLNLSEKLADIRNQSDLESYFADIQPEIVFHLAAQALVRYSYENPVETFSTNVIGTLNVFEACKKTESVKAIVNVTSDKCYDNKEWIWGYRENDPMGGYDPYSASKGCSELLTASYRNSYFNAKTFETSHHVLMASARAGNVIGGGDWAEDRLIPDIVRATSANESVQIRNPKATRPWQHVLEPLSGYLTLGMKLLQKETYFADGWNFGPEYASNLAVDEILSIAKIHWNNIDIEYSKDLSAHHEANLLMLDCSKAIKILKWKPVWDIDKTLEKTILWYKNFYNFNQVSSESDLNSYVEDAITKEVSWTLNH